MAGKEQQSSGILETAGNQILPATDIVFTAAKPVVDNFSKTAGMLIKHRLSHSRTYRRLTGPFTY